MIRVYICIYNVNLKINLVLILSYIMANYNISLVYKKLFNENNKSHGDIFLYFPLIIKINVIVRLNPIRLSFFKNRCFNMISKLIIEEEYNLT